MKNIKLINLINPVCNIAIEAGKVVNKYYKKKQIIKFKFDQSPCTEADIESNKIIKRLLINIDKKIPILSEESIVKWSERKNWKTYWLIDPLDGTKEFIKERDEFTINIALIKHNRPILGIIYAPALKVLYFAFSKGGSFKAVINDENNIKNILNSCTSIYTSKRSKDSLLKIICSRSHFNSESLEWIKKNIKNYEIVNKGSSIKFCYIAEGRADIYPRFRPTSEWDIAAGHIILEEAGGKILSINNEEIMYNVKESVINPYFIASYN